MKNRSVVAALVLAAEGFHTAADEEKAHLHANGRLRLPPRRSRIAAVSRYCRANDARDTDFIPTSR